MVFNNTTHVFSQIKKSYKAQTQLLLIDNINKKSVFNSDLVKALLFANISLYNNLKIINFLENYTFKNIPDESTLRNNDVNSIYHQQTLTKIQTKVFNRNIWV